LVLENGGENRVLCQSSSYSDAFRYNNFGHVVTVPGSTKSAGPEMSDRMRPRVGDRELAVDRPQSEQ